MPPWLNSDLQMVALGSVPRQEFPLLTPPTTTEAHNDTVVVLMGSASAPVGNIVIGE